MEFSTPEEASGFYNNYNQLKGFASRRGKTVRNTSGEIVRYTFFYNRQRFREKKWLEKVDRKREHKVVTRCRCLTEMRIKRKDGSEKCHCQEDYSVFDDVLAFDATYSSNKYNLPVLVFSGFLECMQKNGGQSFITDGDPAMRIAIQSVFSDVHHQSCAWHLLKNATSNICDPRLTQLFRYRMLADMEIDEFEAYWESMVNECGVSEVYWVKYLSKKKYAWATTYIRDRFFAVVYREPISNSFSCTCMRMELFATPWVHIVAVCLCKQLARVACMSDEDFKVYSKKLLADTVFLEIKYGLRLVNNVLTTVADVGVKDPVRVRTKGTGRCSQSGGSAAKNRRKCSSCGKLGHQRTRYNGGM
ncbi:hypothetical protein AHAS_Ahas05G0119300 [Arachis hypogaea]